MMAWVLSILPRQWLAGALSLQWQSTLSSTERMRLSYWGATGNPDHHEFQWADRIANRKRPPACDGPA